MAAPNANPTNCGGVSVSCCSGRVPEVLKAAFSGTTVCGFTSDVYLRWNGGSGAAGYWVLAGVGCSSAVEVRVQCSGGVWVALFSGASGCSFGSVLTSSVCDGPDGFKLVFTVTQTTVMGCPCCNVNDAFTMTVTNGMAA